MQVTMTTTNHKVHDVFLAIDMVDRCDFFAVIVTLD
jgi:hypothetical protein